MDSWISNHKFWIFGIMYVLVIREFTVEVLLQNLKLNGVKLGKLCEDFQASKEQETWIIILQRNVQTDTVLGRMRIVARDSFV